MTVLMAGCGDLGTEIGVRFAELGHRVVGLRRTPDRLPAGIEGRHADLTGELPELPADTDIVVVALTAEQYTAEAYRAIYVDGLRNTLDALDRDDIRPRRVLFVSSTAVYGVRDGGWIDEETPASTTSATGSVLVEAERLLHSRVPDGIVVRLAGLYGPGRTSLIEQVRSGTATVPEPAPHTNRIHRDDAASVVVHLATNVPDPDPIYVGADHHPVDRGELVRFLADETGAPAPTATPPDPARSLGKRCDNRRLLATGFPFTYPTYREGYRAVLAGHGTRHP